LCDCNRREEALAIFHFGQTMFGFWVYFFHVQKEDVRPSHGLATRFGRMGAKKRCSCTGFVDGLGERKKKRSHDFVDKKHKHRPQAGWAFFFFLS
jgi:hypothetical protein